MKGLTTLEVLIAILILTFSFVPLYSIFRFSYRLNASSKNLNHAMHLANNLLSGVKLSNNPKLPNMKHKNEKALKYPLSLEQLGLQQSPPGFKRYLTITDFQDELMFNEFKKIWVDIEWTSTLTKKTVSYRLSGVIRK